MHAVSFEITQKYVNNIRPSIHLIYLDLIFFSLNIYIAFFEISVVAYSFIIITVASFIHSTVVVIIDIAYGQYLDQLF